jgi:hypothetical protein
MNEPLQRNLKKNYPLVSIISINYNNSYDTCDLIESLNNISYPNFEIIIVDNCSTSDNPQIIKEKYPNITLIINNINVGFPGGNNVGILKAKGKYILLLNNDCIVTKNFLEPLVEKLENNSNIGAVSPKIKFFYNPEKIQYAGSLPVNKYTIRTHAIGYNETDTGQYDTDSETYCTHGAAMMVPIEIIKKVGLMSYIFFLYYEELDWIERIKRAGYKVFYVHNSVVYHKESKSTGKLSPLKIYYLNRNRILYLRRNTHGKVFIIAILFQLLIAIPKNATFFLLKGKFNLFYAYLRAIIWHIKNLFNENIFENPKL